MISLVMIGFLILALPLDEPPTDKAPACTSEAVDQTLRPLVDSGKVVGLCVGVIQGENSYVFGLGTTQRGPQGSTPNGKTIFEIGSISKVFTASLLAEAVERGDLKLDDPVASLVPTGVNVPSRNEKPITLRHLATHSSGLPRLPSNLKPNPIDPYKDYSPDDLFHFLANHSLSRDPGADYEYSNYGIGLLGHVLAMHANKTDYEALVVERICEPLGMLDTYLRVNQEQSSRFAQGYATGNLPAGRWEILTLGGAGGIRSTMDDMLKFARFCMEPDDSPLGRSIQNGWKPLFPMGQAPESPRVGLCWIVNPDGKVWHNGQTGGYHSLISLEQKTKTAVVLLSNSATPVIDRAGFQLHNLISNQTSGQAESH